MSVYYNMSGNLKEQLLNLVNEQLDNIQLDKIFDAVNMNLILDKGSLIIALESCYYRDLITKHKRNDELLGYLSLLRDETAKPSQFTLLYIIYRLQRIIENKAESIEDFNLYI